MKKIIIYIMLMVALINIAFAQNFMPNKMSYQGYLMDKSSNPLTGTYTIDFAIYDSALGGNNLWDETGNSIVVTRGIYNYELGHTHPLNLSGNQSYYLEIIINTQSLGRANITQSMWAQRAQMANNLTEANNYRVTNITASGYFIGQATNLTEANNYKIANLTASEYIIATKNITASNFIFTGIEGLVIDTLRSAWVFKYANSAAAASGLYFNVTEAQFQFRYLGVTFFGLDISGNPGLYIYGASADDNDTIYFDDGSKYFRWSDSIAGGTDRFIISDALEFINGEFIDNLVDGWLRITGNLNVTNNILANNITVAGFVIGDGSLLTGVQNASKAAIGNCTAGQIVQNTTTGGVQCIDLPVTTDIWVNATGDNMTGNLNMGQFNISNIGSLIFNNLATISNLVSGWLRITGNLNVTNNITADTISTGGDINIKGLNKNLNIEHGSILVHPGGVPGETAASYSPICVGTNFESCNSNYGLWFEANTSVNLNPMFVFNSPEGGGSEGIFHLYPTIGYFAGIYGGDTSAYIITDATNGFDNGLTLKLRDHNITTLAAESFTIGDDWSPQFDPWISTPASYISKVFNPDEWRTVTSQTKFEYISGEVAAYILSFWIDDIEVATLDNLGNLNVTGNLSANGYKSSDGSPGITNTTGLWMCMDSSCTTKCQVSIKNGLIVGCS